MALSENAGLSPITMLSNVKARQAAEKNPRIGVDCISCEEVDMKDRHIFETLIGKQQQFQLATQLARMLLKIDDVVAPNSFA